MRGGERLDAASRVRGAMSATTPEEVIVGYLSAPGMGRYVRTMDSSSRFCQCQSWLMFGFPVQLFIGIGVVNEQCTNRAEEL